MSYLFSPQVIVIFIFTLLLNGFIGKRFPILGYFLWILFLIKLLLPFGIYRIVSPELAMSQYIYDHAHFAYSQIPSWHSKRSMQMSDDSVPAPSVAGDSSLQDLKEISNEKTVPFYARLDSYRLRVWMLVVWFLGSVLIWLRELLRYANSRRKINSWPVIRRGKAYELLVQCVGMVKLSRIPKVVSGDSNVHFPFTFGFLTHSQIIVIPQRYFQKSQRELLNAIYIHELAHIKKRDHLINLLRLVCLGLFHLHPLRMIADRFLDWYKEITTDLLVLKITGMKKAWYLDSLLQVFISLSAQRNRVSFQSPFLTGSSSTIKRLLFLQDYSAKENRFRTILAYVFSALILILFCLSVSVSTPQFDPKLLTITTIAGAGVPGYSGDKALGTLAQMRKPFGLAVDNNGNVYIADTENHRIRKVTPTGIITTFAGSGSEGYSGDGGPADQAQLDYPYGIAVDRYQNVYFTELQNHCVRKVDTRGIITTVAGGVTTRNSEDNIPAIQAMINRPISVEVDPEGNIYFADYYDQRVRKVDTNGIIHTLAGTGIAGDSGDGGSAISAQMNFPVGVKVDNQGNVYICEDNGHKIRRVNSKGIISTIAGTGAAGYSGDNGIATQAQLCHPTDIALDREGNLYIADGGNHRIRKIDPYGIIMTIAGTGQLGYTGDNGPALSAKLFTPVNVTVDKKGHIYFSDKNNLRVRMIYYQSESSGWNLFL